jgi:hypothetical protein
MITSYEQWLQEYRKDKYKIWIRATLSNNQEYYLPDVKDWKDLKEICKTNKLKVKKVGLQYRSHSIEVDTSDTDGVYLIKSVIGMIGETTKQTVTIGKLYGDTIYKSMWITPELIEELKTKDSVADSFEEVLIYDYQKEQTRTI